MPVVTVHYQEHHGYASLSIKIIKQVINAII